MLHCLFFQVLLITNAITGYVHPLDNKQQRLNSNKRLARATSGNLKYFEKYEIVWFSSALSSFGYFQIRRSVWPGPAFIVRARRGKWELLGSVLLMAVYFLYNKWRLLFLLIDVTIGWWWWRPLSFLIRNVLYLEQI